MRHFLRTALLPGLVAAIVLTATATSHAQLFGLYWGSYYPSYSTYYTPSYSTYYAPSTYTASYVPSYTASYVPSTYTASYVPSYTASYAPSTYTASYVPSVSYYAGSSCCAVQTSYSVAACPTCPTTCCDPCAACVACPTTCCDPCAACSPVGGTAASAQPPAASGTTGTPPTFIEEQDPGTGTQQYDNTSPGTGDGFTPRNPDDSNVTPDPLDQTFGTASAGRRDELRFKIPQPIINRRQPAPSHPLDFHKNPTRRVKSEQEPNYPLLKLDEKITSRSMPKRTRLVERRSWEEPVIAKNIRRETPEINLGWVPVPAPTQLVQK